jgi:phosphate butyryltransferase
MKTYDELVNYIKGQSQRTVAVADASDIEIMLALKEAHSLGLAKSIIVGNGTDIEKAAKEADFSDFELVAESSPLLIAQKSVELVRSGRASMLMKGKVPTPLLLHAVLDQDKGLRTGRLLSHFVLAELEKYPKLLAMTDCGMNIRPTLTQKVDILINAAGFMRKLGRKTPKVAVLAAIELVNQDMPETIDAATLVKMSERDQLGDVYVDGPVAIDIVLSKRAAKIKKIESQLPEDADILLFPDIASGNICAKALIYLAGSRLGGIILGAAAPIILLSRSDTREEKLASITLGCLI